MHYTEPFVGHRTIQRYLQQLLAQRTLPQVNLWVGPEHVGKHALLNNLLLRWFCTTPLTTEQPCLTCNQCVALQQECHPNVQRVELVKDSHSIEIIRPLLYEAGHSRLHAGPFCIIIDQAERLTAAAANALLKLLEEPKAHVYIFLLTSQLDQILPTIQSRCSVLHFRPVAQVELQVLSHDAAILALAHGLPGLVQLWSDPKQRLQLQSDVTRWLDIFTAPLVSTRVQLAEPWLKHKGQTISRRIVELAQYVCRDVLLVQAGCPDQIVFLHERERLQQLATRSTIGDSMHGLAYLGHWQKRLAVPLQLKLMLDNFLLTMYRTV